MRLEEEIHEISGAPTTIELLRALNWTVLPEKYLAAILKIPETDIRNARTEAGIVEAWDTVPVSGVNDAAYYYSTYHTDKVTNPPPATTSTNSKKVIILGGGPNRIGQGIEFDYCLSTLPWR